MQKEGNRTYIYFVRHGESESNAGPMRLGASTVLTQKGREQAQFIGKRLSRLPIEVVIASTMVRAQQTAEIISAEIGKPLESSDLVVERTMPSVVYGRLREDPEIEEIVERVRSSFGMPGWRHSDEETFEALRDRAQAALEMLAARPEQHIAVVTHGDFLRALLGVAVFGNAFTGEMYRRMRETFRHKNTGLSLFVYDSSDSQYPWSIRTWSDHSHLG